MRSIAAPLLACAPFALAALAALVACKPSAPNGTPAATSVSTETGAPVATATPSLGKGDRAPPFSLAGSDGKTHSLAEHAGKEVVVVAWFPKAFTGG